jgi:hypothetical protein
MLRLGQSRRRIGIRVAREQALAERQISRESGMDGTWSRLLKNGYLVGSNALGASDDQSHIDIACGKRDGPS